MPLLGAKRSLFPAPAVVAGGFIPTSSESAAFLARATNVVLTADKTRYDTLISGFVSDGTWSLFDLLYMWATVDTTTALLSLIDATYNASVVGSGTFTTYQGYTGDGSTFAINTNFNPNTASSPKYVLNSATVGFYNRSNITSGGTNGTNAGAHHTGDSDMSSFAFGNIVYHIHGAVGVAANATSQGQYITTRTDSSTTAMYKNGSTTAIETDSTTSDFVPRVSYYFFAQHGNSDTVDDPSVAQMSAGFIGAGMTNVQTSSVAGRINDYMTDLAINVY